MEATTTQNHRARPPERLAEGMGWFSLALGAPQLLRPDLVDHAIGVYDDERSRLTQRLVGVRELAAAAGLLVQRRYREWLWARSAGDVLDLALLGVSFVRKDRDPRRLAVATASVVGVLATDLYGAIRFSSSSEGSKLVKASITIRAPREEVERRWRQLVRQPGTDLRLAPLEVTVDEPGRRVTFRTPDGADRRVSGVARFVDAPGDRGTEVHVEMEYEPGALGGAVQKLMGEEPLQLIKDDLRRFRQLLEVGEIVRSESTPGGVSAKEYLRQRPAQPAEHAHA